MAKYLLAYKGGGAPSSDAEREAVMAAWGKWFGELGPAIVDPGNPFSGSTAVTANGASSNGAPSGLTGYSVISANDLSTAAELAQGCPLLADGGTVEIYETHEVM